MWTSYMTEDHSATDGMYIHGMRKAVSNIAWWACQDAPKTNTELPMIPPDLTQDQFVQIIRAMQLEVSLPEPAGCSSDEAADNAGGEPIALPATAGADQAKRPKHTTLVMRLEQQQQQGGSLVDLLQIQVAARDNSANGQGEEAAARHHDLENAKLSIYPIGMINTRSALTGNMCDLCQQKQTDMCRHSLQVHLADPCSSGHRQLHAAAGSEELPRQGYACHRGAGSIPRADAQHRPPA